MNSVNGEDSFTLGRIEGALEWFLKEGQSAEKTVAHILEILEDQKLAKEQIKKGD